MTHLSELTTYGTVAVKTCRRATALLALHAGQNYSAVAAALSVRYATVSDWAERFRATGLALLTDRPRSGGPLHITGPERAKVTALACSEAPAGYGQWSLSLLAGKSVELGLCARMSAGSAHAILKKRAPARPEAPVVHRAGQRRLPAAPRGRARALSPAPRRVLSGGVLRRAAVFSARRRG